MMIKDMEASLFTHPVIAFLIIKSITLWITFLSLVLSVCLSCSLCLSLSFSLSLLFSLSLFLSLVLSISVCLALKLCLSLSLSLCLCLSLSPSLCLSPSLVLSVSLYLSFSVPLFVFLTILTINFYWLSTCLPWWGIYDVTYANLVNMAEKLTKYIQD